MKRSIALFALIVLIPEAARAEQIAGKETDTVLLYVACEADRNPGVDAVTKYYGSEASVLAGRDEAQAGDVETGRGDVIFSADGNRLSPKAVFVDPRSVQKQPGKWVAIVRTYVEPWRFTDDMRHGVTAGQLLESSCNGQMCFFYTPKPECAHISLNGRMTDTMIQAGVDQFSGGIDKPLKTAIGGTLRQAIDEGVKFE